MKFIDNTWRVIAENERLQLSKTEGQVRRANCYIDHYKFFETS